MSIHILLLRWRASLAVPSQPAPVCRPVQFSYIEAWNRVGRYDLQGTGRADYACHRCFQVKQVNFQITFSSPVEKTQPAGALARAPSHTN